VNRVGSCLFLQSKKKLKIFPEPVICISNRVTVKLFFHQTGSQGNEQPQNSCDNKNSIQAKIRKNYPEDYRWSKNPLPESFGKRVIPLLPGMDVPLWRFAGHYAVQEIESPETCHIFCNQVIICKVLFIQTTEGE
jgi:hypothetical protein